MTLPTKIQWPEIKYAAIGRGEEIRGIVLIGVWNVINWWQNYKNPPKLNVADVDLDFFAHVLEEYRAGHVLIQFDLREFYPEGGLKPDMTRRVFIAGPDAPLYPQYTYEMYWESTHILE